MEENKNERMTVPGAIVAAGVIIALAIIYTNGSGGTSGQAGNTDTGKPSNIVTAAGAQNDSLINNLKPVDKDDHILGNPNAPVKIVEFSDIECPYCKKFHSTMQQVMDEYGKSGKVAWVYRHFPLKIHPKATPEAYATECAVEQGGNDMFWNYLDRMIERSATNNQTDPVVMTEIASSLGLDLAKFKACQDSGRYVDLVKAHIADGLSAGVEGTPYSIVIGPNGKKYPIGGAFPYETVKETIDIALSEG